MQKDEITLEEKREAIMKLVNKREKDIYHDAFIFAIESYHHLLEKHIDQDIKGFVVGKKNVYKISDKVLKIMTDSYDIATSITDSYDLAIGIQVDKESDIYG